MQHGGKARQLSWAIFSSAGTGYTDILQVRYISTSAAGILQ